MKRALILLALAGLSAAPAAAQWEGMPVWNNPKGGTGVTISGDFGKPNTDAREGTAWGARATLGLVNLSLTAGLATWKPQGYSESRTSTGGVAAFRVIGGSLLPVALNIQLGGATATAIGTGANAFEAKRTNIIAGAGISASVPSPGVNIEPYLSVTNRWHTRKLSGVSSTESNVGFTVGANVGLGMLGLHLAYDSENLGAGLSAGIFGVGAHVALRAGMGM